MPHAIITRCKSRTLKRYKQTQCYPNEPFPGTSAATRGAVTTSPHDPCSAGGALPKRADSGTALASSEELPRPRTASSTIKRLKSVRSAGATIPLQQSKHRTFESPTPSPEAAKLSRGKLLRDPTVDGSIRQDTSLWKQSRFAFTLAESTNTGPADGQPFNDAAIHTGVRSTIGSGKMSRIRWLKCLFDRRPSVKAPATPAPKYQQNTTAQTPSVPCAPQPKSHQADDTKGKALLTKYRKSSDAEADEQATRNRTRSEDSAAVERPTVPLPFPPPPKMPNVKMSQTSQSPSREELGPLLSSAEGSPMLNVEIPSTEMERYSVMFGSLLKGDRHLSSDIHNGHPRAERLGQLKEDYPTLAGRSSVGHGQRGRKDRPKSIGRSIYLSPVTPGFQLPTSNLAILPCDSTKITRAYTDPSTRSQSLGPVDSSASKAHCRLQRSSTAPILPRPSMFAFNGERRCADQPGLPSSRSTLTAFEKHSTPYNCCTLDLRKIGVMAIKGQAAIAQTNVDAACSDPGQMERLECQSTSCPYSERSVAWAKEGMTRQSSLRRKQRLQQLHNRALAEDQSSLAHLQASITAHSEMAHQGQREPSHSTSSKSGNSQGGPGLHADTDITRQRQQSSPDPQSPSTLKERPHEVALADGIEIAQHVSIIRQRAQQDMFRTQRTVMAHSSHDSIDSLTTTNNHEATFARSKDISSLAISGEDAQPRIARQESLRRAGRNATPTTMIVKGPTGERIIKRRTLTPVLVDIPNRKSVVGSTSKEL